jgi:hypothetical protein
MGGVIGSFEFGALLSERRGGITGLSTVSAK